MNRRRNAALAVIGTMLLVFSMTAPQASAQAGGASQVITGQTVTWNAEWTPLPDLSIADQYVELLAFSHDSAIVGYGGTSFPVSANDVRDILLEGFASEQDVRQVDRGNYDNVSYSIDLSTSEGVTLATFALVIENPANTTMALLIASPSGFSQGMSAAQAGISIDGAPIFDGVDVAQMQATIDAASQSGQTSNTTEAPAPAQTETPVATGNGGLGDLGTAINGDESTPPAQAPSGQAPSASAPANAHVIPASGVEVRYSDEWSVSMSNDTNVRFQAASQPVIVSVVWVEQDAPKTSEPHAFANSLLQSDTFAGATLVDAVTVTGGEHWLIVLNQVVEGQEISFVIEVVSQPTGGATLTSVMTPVTNLPGALQAVPASMQIAGQPVLADAASHVPALSASGM